MKYAKEEYRRRVLGCFLGKNAGGTLGMRDEWHRRVNHVSAYVHDLSGAPLPNDDMDLQLVWLVAMEEQGVNIDAKCLGDYWTHYITPYWAEYGNCKMNLLRGLEPPFSGTFHNPYKDSCGAYIRSEIWACMAPGRPDIAVQYAYEDALVDHGEGEGLYAEIFCAAMESAAFVESDLRRLMDIGLSYLPEGCAVSQAVRLSQKLYDSGVSWEQAREEILRNFLGGFIFTVSPEDEKKGLVNGRVGWEAPSNVALVTTALLYGQGDFGKTICIAVNCGEDTDCTAATAGALLGIVYGIDGIPEEWAKPVGTTLNTACLNLGELGNLGSQLPKDIFQLQSRLEKLMLQAMDLHGADFSLTETDTTISDFPLCCPKDLELYRGEQVSRYRFRDFDIDVEYQDGPGIWPGCRKQVRFLVHNRSKTSENLHLHIYAEDAQVLPCADGQLHLPEGGWFRNQNEIQVEFLFSQMPRTVIRAIAEFTLTGRAAPLLIPLVFCPDGEKFSSLLTASAETISCP